MHKDTITKEIMQECIDQGMTQTEMAVSLDASFETIHRLLKRYDLKPAYNHDTGKYDEEKMKRCLQQGMTAKEIAELEALAAEQPAPEPTAEERIAVLEEALNMLLSGVTE